ncbi:MAG: ABC transporter permease subunit [Gemmatimonas sp.]
MTHSRRALAVGVVLVLPVVVGFAYALLGATDVIGGLGQPPGLARIQRVLSEAAVWRGTAWAMWVAVASTTLAALLAVVLSLVYDGTSRTDRLARALMNVPLAFPHLVAAAVGLLVLGQSGMLARILMFAGVIADSAHMPELVSDRFGVGVIVALTWKEAPFLLLINAAVLSGHGRGYQEVARTHGASRWQVLQRVTWPLLWRGMSPALVAVAVFAFGSYETMVLLAPSNPLALPLLTAERYVDPALARRNDAFVLAVLSMVIGLIAVAVYERLRSRIEDVGHV